MTYVWKDICLINGEFFFEEAEISGETDVCDGLEYYQLDDFYQKVAEKHGVETDDVLTLTMDGFEDCGESLPEEGILRIGETDIPEKMKKYAADCGCYIDGVPEWEID